MEKGFIQYWVEKGIKEDILRDLLGAIDYDGYIIPEHEGELKEFLKRRGD